MEAAMYTHGQKGTGICGNESLANLGWLIISYYLSDNTMLALGLTRLSNYMAHLSFL